MKRLFLLAVFVCMLIVQAPLALCNSDEVTMYDGADLTSITRLAIASPRYPNVHEGAPTLEELRKMMFDDRRVSNIYVLSYDEIAKNIRRDKKIDIKVLDRAKAEKAFRDSVGDYADAYVEVFVANNSRTQFFFDVYKAGEPKKVYLFTYKIVANRSEKDTPETFKNFIEQFYKHLERATEDQRKERAKGEKEIKLPEENAPAATTPEKPETSETK